jgi:hypothetical protein
MEAEQHGGLNKDMPCQKPRCRYTYQKKRRLDRPWTDISDITDLGREYSLHSIWVAIDVARCAQLRNRGF